MVFQKTNLEIEQKQTLSLTPQLLQAIEVLRMTSVELDEFIEVELENNPLLEANWDSDENEITENDADSLDERAPPDRRAEDFDWVEYLKEKDYSDVSYGYGTYSESTQEYRNMGQSLSEYLLEQLTTEDLNRISANSVYAYELVEFISELLDENGFLAQTVSEIAVITGATEEEVAGVNCVLQDMEPAGVATANVRACLELQYKRNGGTDPLIIEIINTRLKDVASRSVGAVARSLRKKQDEIEHAFKIIGTLNPKPGRGFGDGTIPHYIVPDLIIENVDEKFEIKLNNVHQPTLSVSPHYKRILLESEKGGEAYNFLIERLQAAAALIKSIEQRGQTIHNVMTAILDHQDRFLYEGEACLKPLSQRQIAEQIGVHISTVSRAIRGKYIQTPYGVIEMKRFFSAGINTADGKGATAAHTTTLIVSMVNSEDKKAPLSDRLIANILEKEGIFISRRTVAKYRNSAGIASSSKRAER